MYENVCVMDEMVCFMDEKYRFMDKNSQRRASREPVWGSRRGRSGAGEKEFE
jgi:hypothetical protein